MWGHHGFCVWRQNAYSHSHYVDFDDVTQSPLLLLKKLNVYDIILYLFAS